MLSYHNNPELKQLIVDEMKLHQQRDQFIKGAYKKEEDGQFKGCAVGCAIHSFNTKLGKDYLYEDHKAFEEAIGVPEWLAYLQDRFFEYLPNEESAQFAVDFLDAIPVGVDLNIVKHKFCAFLMKENIERVLNLPNLAEELRKQVIDAIQQILELHQQAINTGNWDENAAKSAREAAESAEESAAESAAARAAESAARAAESAAWSAAYSAESAAYSAVWGASNAVWGAAMAGDLGIHAYQKYASELLKLLKECETNA